MAALTATASLLTVFGNKRVQLYTLGAVADADTLATQMSKIDAAFTQITDAAAAADALTVTAVASGKVTFGVVGTISGAYCLVIGT